MRSPLLLALCTGTALAGAEAQILGAEGSYISYGAGSYDPKRDNYAFDGPVGSFTLDDGTLELEGTGSIRALIGKRLTRHIVGEVETGGRLFKVGEIKVGNIGYAQPTDDGGFVYTFVNALIDAELWRLRIYYGGGGGFIAGSIDEISTTTGYQLKGGADLRINRNSHLGVEFSRLRGGELAVGANFEGHDGALTIGGNSIMATFRYTPER